MKKYLLILMAAVVLLPLSSCDDFDDWFDDDLWEYATEEHDLRLEDALTGHWYLSFVRESVGECPYYSGDDFFFHRDGTFEVEGNKGFHELGYWFVEDGELVVSFHRPYHTDLVGRLQRMNRHFVALRVHDYDTHAIYDLELER